MLILDKNINGQVGLKNKFGFALGHVLNDVCACMGITYGLVFFHKVLQFNHMYAGLLVLIGQIADGFSTVFVGIFSDKGDNLWLCDQFGQRKAWHLIGVVCVIISFPFIFSLCLVCDENTHQYAKLVYFSSFMLVFQFGWACSQISHLSAIPALAQNQNERTSLTAIRYSVTIISQVMVYLTAWAFLSGIGGDRMVKPEDAYAFQNTMLICIGVGFFASIGYHVITKLPYSNGNIDGDWLGPPSPLLPRPLPALTPSPVQSNAPRFNGNTLDAHTEEALTSTPNIESSQAMSIFCWFKEYQLYQIAVIYMSSRFFNNISQSYLPLFLQLTLKLHATYIATVPLAMFVSAFATSFTMEWVNNKFGRKITAIIGAIFGIFGCLWMRYGCIPGDPSVQYHVFFVAILLGIGGTTMLVTSLSLTAEFIGSNTSSSAFVYGAMSFLDKLSTGFGVFFIQHFTPEFKSQNGTYYGEVILYTCGGAGILIILGAVSLFFM